MLSIIFINSSKFLSGLMLAIIPTLNCLLLFLFGLKSFVFTEDLKIIFLGLLLKKE